MSKSANKASSSRKPIKIGPLTLITIISSAALIVFIFAICAYIAYLLLELPDITPLKNYNPPVVTEVYDSKGNPIAYWYEEKRWFVGLDEVPKDLIKAILAAEDARFFEHKGIDFFGVIRAIIKNVEAGEIVQGASTITQQVTRALLLNPEKSFKRKIKEAILAWQIESYLTKKEILTIYLNHIYFGQNAYGVEAASRAYFGKHVKDLTLAECAFIAGLPQAPSRYNLHKNRELALNRQAHVIKRMLAEGFITKEEAEEALSYPIELTPEILVPPPGAEYFLADLRRKLEEKFGKKVLYTEGLKIYTTLDPEWQKKAYEAVNNGIKAYLKRYPKDNERKENIMAALVAMELKTGKIRAMIGGPDFNKIQFNLATQGKMQPGSSFKTFIYTAALERGVIDPNTIITDEPIVLPGSSPTNPWTPQNYDGEFMGPITVKTALTHSRNIVAIKVLQMVGIDATLDNIKRLGIETEIAPNYTMALGSTAVSLLEMVKAYSAYPNLGEVVEPSYIEYIQDRRGRFLEVHEPKRWRAIDPVTAYQMLHMLQAVVQEGTGRKALKLNLPAAGKTGTTNDFKDAWFVGFTPDVVAGVWVGRLDKKSLGPKETGGTLACPIWTEFMEVTKSLTAGKKFETPPEIVFVNINTYTGRLELNSRPDDPDVTSIAISQSKFHELQKELELSELEKNLEEDELTGLKNTLRDFLKSDTVRD